MSMKLNAGEVGRSDLFHIFPHEIVVDEAENGRANPHSQEEIEALARSILKHLQQQPVVARRIEGNKVKLVSGYGRHKAVAYINKVLRPDNPLKLAVRISEMNNEEAFICNIVENQDRADCTAVDDAHNHRRLREEFGWSEERIAELYKTSVSYLCQLRKTLQLSPAIQGEVASGNLPISTAITLTDLPEEERLEALNEAKNPETGKVSAEKINKRVRNKKIESGKGKGRSLRELRTFFEGLVGPGEKSSVSGLSKKILGYISGKLTDQQMTNAMNKFTPEDAAEPVVESEPVSEVAVEVPAEEKKVA